MSGWSQWKNSDFGLTIKLHSRRINSTFVTIDIKQLHCLATRIPNPCLVPSTKIKISNICYNYVSQITYNTCIRRNVVNWMLSIVIVEWSKKCEQGFEWCFQIFYYLGHQFEPESLYVVCTFLSHISLLAKISRRSDFFHR